LNWKKPLVTFMVTDYEVYIYIPFLYCSKNLVF
jgi:hypothetical protein